MQFESGIDSWFQPCNWLTSWRDFAVKNAILSSLTLLPLLFIFYCAFKQPTVWITYKRVVYVPALCQSLGLLPTIIFLVWFSINIHSDESTSVFVCTITTSCLGIFAFSTFTSPVAISLCRYLIVVRKTPITLRYLVFIIVLFSVPSHLMNCLIIFTGHPQMGGPCTGLIAVSTDITRGYLGLMIVTMTLSFPFNYSFYRFVKDNAHKRSHSSDELSATIGLTLQGIVPFLAFSITLVHKSLLVSNVVIPYWANVLVDSIVYLIPGINIIVSTIFIKMFRRHFRHILRIPHTGLRVVRKVNRAMAQRSTETRSTPTIQSTTQPIDPSQIIHNVYDGRY